MTLTTAIQTKTLTEQSQLDRKEMAKGAWASGATDNAQLILDTVLGEEMSPAIRVECYVTRATFCSDQGHYQSALDALRLAAPDLDSVSPYVQGTFFNERARANKAFGNTDQALTDYAGASACFELAGHRVYEGAVSINSAGLYLKLGRLLEAKIHVERAITIFTAEGSEYLAQAYDTLANILLTEDKLPEALKTADKAVGLIVKNRAWLQTALITRGRIKAKLNMDSAREDFDAAISEAEILESPYNVATACCALIQSLDLPLDDLVAYFLRAGDAPHPEMQIAARIVIGKVIPEGTVEEMQIAMVRRALVKHGGQVTPAAKSIGMSHKGISYFIDQHKTELGHLRKEPRIRHKALFKS